MALIKDAPPAWLVLANGRICKGRHFGASGTALGEVVFSTGMTGYQEALTDPSYAGQILIQTFPQSGNYGVNSEDFDSPKAHVSGYIVREWCNTPSNFRMEDNIDSFLKAQNVIGLYDIDTRSLTRLLRDQGVMNGAVTTEDPTPRLEALLAEIRAFSVQNAVENVTCKEISTRKTDNAACRVVLMDFGCRSYVPAQLAERGCEVITVPAMTAAKDILALRPDGIVLSEGPGDPAENTGIIAEIRTLAESGLPLFGIGLGHQMLALAMGGTTEKLLHGHRGANQPVLDLEGGRTYVTSQNHGYAVTSIPEEAGTVTFINANDRTIEGIRYTACKGFGVQFAPVSHGSTVDTDYLFDVFAQSMQTGKEGK